MPESKSLPLIHQEIFVPPPTEVQVMDHDQAFTYCLTTRRKHEDPRWKNYGFSAPNELRPFIEGHMDEADFKPVFDQWFSTWNARDEKDRLTACIESDTFKKGLAAYLPLQQWGFYVPSAYTVFITPCEIGTGGSYDVGAPGLWDPTVFMYHDRAWPKTKDEEKIMRTTREEVLLHEIFHLGIEDMILRERIDQKNKERIVDTLVKSILFPHVLSSYLTQGYDVDLDKPKPRAIDPYLDITDMAHFYLPQALNSFREQNPTLALLPEDDSEYIRFLARSKTSGSPHKGDYSPPFPK